MTPKLIDLLIKFRQRANTQVIGQEQLITASFAIAANELERALLDSEPPDLAAFMPPSVFKLVAEALHFDQDSEHSWDLLGKAARNIQSGAS